MNHTPVINIWKGSNRVSLLWEELLADLVSPDPPAEENTSAGETWEGEVDLLAARSEQVESAEPGLLERAGFESLRMIRQALEILGSPRAGTCGRGSSGAVPGDTLRLPGGMGRDDDTRPHTGSLFPKYDIYQSFQ